MDTLIDKFWADEVATLVALYNSFDRHEEDGRSTYSHLSDILRQCRRMRDIANRRPIVTGHGHFAKVRRSDKTIGFEWVEEGCQG